MTPDDRSEMMAARDELLKAIPLLRNVLLARIGNVDWDYERRDRYVGLCDDLTRLEAKVVDL